MEHFGALDVIGEESEYDDEDINRSGMFVRYKSEASVSETNNDIFGWTDNNNRIVDSKIGCVDKNVNFPDSDRKRSSCTLPDRRASSHTRKQRATIEPTYRLEPKPEEYFIWYKVKQSLNKLIGPLFENYKYQSPVAGNFCRMICNKALATVKRKHEWPRYRFVCHVTLVELNNQGVIIADRSLMLPGIDNCAVCCFNNKEVVMVVTFHGVYFE